MEHSRVTVDGVSVLHLPSEHEQTSVSLIFAVGARDESLPRFGSLHALEHLCMGAVRDTALDINASVDRLTTQFSAYGRPALVGPWLTRLCEVLAEPPVHRLQQEASVLVAEGEGIGTPVDPLHLVRFGNQDLGLGVAPTPSPRSLSVEQLAADAHRWFVAENALLVVDGPLPDLKLPLPHGEPLAHAWPEPARFDRPTAVLLEAGCVGASLLLPPPDASGLDQLAGRLIENRVSEAIRHQRSLAYHVDRDGWPIPGRSTVMTVWAEPGRGNDEAASLVLLDSVTDLLTAGPSSTELETAREQVLASHRGRDGYLAAAIHAALGEMFFGSADTELQIELVEAVTVDTITGFLGERSTDLLFLLADGAAEEVRSRGLSRRGLEPLHPELPQSGTVYRPSLVARMISAEARTVRLVTTADALWLEVEGEVTRARWQDAAGLLDDQDTGLTVLYSLDGTAIPVDDRISGCSRALDEIRTHVPAELWYTNEPEGDSAPRPEGRPSRKQ